MSRRATFVCVAAVAAALAAASPAGADVFGPIELTSTSALLGVTPQQAGEAQQPAISADGRFAAFVGFVAGEGGIWRRDLATGALEQVVGGDATSPSISADGRYVSFTTTARLAPRDDRNRAPDVYVRDMSVPCSTEGGACAACAESEEEEEATGPCPFTIASAVSGSADGATYTYTGANPFYADEEAHFGSLASGRSGISADGRYVAFETTAASNVLGEPTPPLQVLVRDLATRQTTLVSAEYEPVAGRPANGEDRPVPLGSPDGGGTYDGAVYPGGLTTPAFPSRWAGASISADGSTVAWMGQEVERQAQLLPAEQARPQPFVAEPLWRRIADGPSAPTRRVTGGSDPTNPLCAASGEQQLPSRPTLADPCSGPFEVEPGVGLWSGRAAADFVPQLSADGKTVAFLTGARYLAAGEAELGFVSDDLYLADMSSGLTRVQAVRRLTEQGGGNASDVARTGAIIDYSVSPDASQVALVTQRTVFPLGSPSYVSTPAAAPGMVELYDIDLLNDTLTRVTHGFAGEDQRSEQPHGPERPGVDPYSESEGAFTPTFSAAGDTLSFSSTADNLVYGDGNGAPDAFVVSRLRFAPVALSQYVASPPASPSPQPDWRIGVRARSHADGSVLVYVTAPGAGSVGVAARSTVLVSAHGTGARKRTTGSRRASKTRALARIVATAGARLAPGGEDLAALSLKLAPAYRSLSARRGGLSASLTVTFTAPGHRALHVNVPVTFARTTRRPAHKSTRVGQARGHASSSRSRSR